jgi:hypothetical protein
LTLLVAVFVLSPLWFNAPASADDALVCEEMAFVRVTPLLDADGVTNVDFEWTSFPGVDQFLLKAYTADGFYREYRVAALGTMVPVSDLGVGVFGFEVIPLDAGGAPLCQPDLEETSSAFALIEIVSVGAAPPNAAPSGAAPPDADPCVAPIGGYYIVVLVGPGGSAGIPSGVCSHEQVESDDFNANDHTLPAGHTAWEIHGNDNANNITGGLSTDDKIYGYGGDDTLNGDSDGDLDNVTTGTDFIDGGDGNDTINGDANGRVNHITGGDDTLVGGAGDDVISGESIRGSVNSSGNDTMNGSDGDDLLLGGDGDDILFGDDGDDTINGGDGGDILFGDDGDDSADGGAGNDTCFAETEINCE